MSSKHTNDSEILNQTRNIWYPPGGILMWMIIMVELITFFMGIGSMLLDKRADNLAFLKMQSELNVNFALINTFLLVTSGYAVALAVYYFERGRIVFLFIGSWFPFCLDFCFWF